MRGRSRAVRRVFAPLALAFLLAGTTGVAAGALQPGSHSVAMTTVDGVITPVVANHLRDAVGRADDAGHAALVVRLDTPGGLVASMEEIVQSFLNAPLPVIVYVAPSGAKAASAGTYITMAAHVAAMAPATTIGAATPVDLQGGEVGDKVVNDAASYARAVAEERGRDTDFAVDAVRDGRSITAEQALDIDVVDVVAADLATVLAEIDGTTVMLDDREVTLTTADAAVVPLEMSLAQQLLQRIADPNLAFIFLSIGTLAIVYEVANPGLGAGGIIGAISIVLAMFALSVLPVNYVGAALLVLGCGLLIAELFIPGVGVGAVGGTAALLLGGLFLFDRPSGIGIDLVVLLPTVIVVLALTVLAGWMVGRSRGRPSRAASDALIGRTATVMHVAEARPRVRLDGTWWRVRPAPDVRLVEGQPVTVVNRHNLELVVVPAAVADGARGAAPGRADDVTGTPTGRAGESAIAAKEPT